MAACSPIDPSKSSVVDTAWSIDDPEAGSCAAIYDGPDARILPPDRTFAACDSASPIWYEDVAVAWGFTPPIVDGNDHSKGGTVAVHDFNNDGWLDIMFGYNNADLMYFVGSADGFGLPATAIMPRVTTVTSFSGAVAVVGLKGRPSRGVCAAVRYVCT